MNETITPEWVRRRAPLVHLITNYVTANDCANLLLAAGASPIMADDPLEAAEITSGCSSLVLNLGTLNPRHAEAMLLAGKEANRLGHPVLLDPVGIGASAFRADTAAGLLKQLRFSVIRGNLSEICRLAGIPARAHGVDVSAEAAQTDFCSLLAAVKRFSLSCGAVIIATGPTDLVVSGRQAARLRNGHPVRRLNWSLTVNPRLDVSAESLPEWAPDRTTVTAENAGKLVYLRIELQPLHRLPRSNAIVFPIRTYLLNLEDIATNPAWAKRMHRVLKSLNQELVDYKGFTRYRDAAVEWLSKYDDGK